MDKKILKKVEKIINEFFQKMTFEVGFTLEQAEEDVLSLKLETKDPQILIGERGKTLIEIQRVLGKALRKETGQNVYLNLDINQYKENKERYLKELVQNLADRVSLEGREKILSPMFSYERRIVHLALSKRNDVQTESIGEEPERRVIIKPI